MHKVHFVGLALALSFTVCTCAAQFAQSVAAYNPGIGFATDFSTGAGFTNALAVLGEPSRITPGPFGGPVDPFNPPYLREQLVSIGAGGSLTVGFGTPIVNRPENPFGIDFIIFGNAGFVITNGNFTGGGITDGSLFGANAGHTRVSVSTDNLTWYLLDPAKAPTVDGLFPTDGVGELTKAIDPALTSLSFGGRDLAGIRELYAGSGGGTGFDVAWAQDEAGRSVNLPSASFVRIEVVSGASEVDGIAIVPEPATWALLAFGIVLLLARKRVVRVGRIR